MKKIILLTFILLISALTLTPNVLAQDAPGVPVVPFVFAVDIMGQGYSSENCNALRTRAGYCFGLETDLEKIKKAYNTINVVSSIPAYWDRWLIRVIQKAREKNLAVIINSSTATNVEQWFTDLSLKVKNHPNVIGFRVVDEIGSTNTIDFWLSYLRKTKAGIRKNSQAPIMVDVIPCEYVHNNPSWCQEKYPAMTLSAIDRYVNSGYIDALILSLGNDLEADLKTAVDRWGGKVKIYVRNGSAIKLNLSFPPDAEIKTKILNRQNFIRDNGAIGTSDYAWRHESSPGDEYRMLNADGTETSIYRALVATFQAFGSPRFNFPAPPISTPTPILLPGDLNRDNKVDIFDYNLLVQHFGNTTCRNVADIDGNCKVDIFDYNILVGNFGKTN